ncbi:hypothetical protein [Bythopirellula goksoeyrii]|uniref:hypothetical protein n=1 Tax=Bythopirellula goksoeyrii TaxID=1400387 RepID=UPI0011CEA563|nr:hypothetical protein [Bythopirellula goksoeyrii]
MPDSLIVTCRNRQIVSTSAAARAGNLVPVWHGLIGGKWHPRGIIDPPLLTAAAAKFLGLAGRRVLATPVSPPSCTAN